MRTLIIIKAIIFFVITINTAFGQNEVENITDEKMMLEVESLINGINSNSSVENLIEWKASKFKKNNVSIWGLCESCGKKHICSTFEKRDKLVFFMMQKDSIGLWLYNIDYFHNSYKKTVYSNDSEKKYAINDNTKFKAYMSFDKLRDYFCIINNESILIWVLSSGSIVTHLEYNKPK